ncbi:(2Fe-2S) ferredoxin domain-containing protein [Bacteroides sp. 214]|uniref:NAD(P)H-dependent oxidoreductase subunit E n=1 Tax=Bacteroides sp. 214 TaxID=2302935 RepID=UPI0013D6EBBF|nr:NAD(P)H-dependent oxidoreductase subunit E [Bacteroides sp. 214]NDW13751.1 (2Fe-2S) ferredoxin domain-containing protein [Bacteroides sp. 214]
MKKRSIKICLGSSCFSRGNKANLEAIKAFIVEKKLEVTIEFSGCLCMDKCNRGPVIIIDETEYETVSLSGLHKILQEEFPC